MNKVTVLSAEDAVALIPEGASIAYSGFGGMAHPEQLSAALEKRFLEKGHPRNLNLIFPAGQGSEDRGVSHLAHEGLLKRVIGGHYGRTVKLMKFVANGGCEAYNLPQGVISQLYREAAAKRPGLLTSVGLYTFVDPRLEGGKLNSVTHEDIVKVLPLEGQDWLFYKTPPITIALIRGTYADEWGNISTEKEAVHTECLASAQAAKNAGGLVLVQVEKIVPAGTLHPKKVRIPGNLVTAVVVDPDQWQTRGSHYNEAFSGDARAPFSGLAPLPYNERKIIASRAAQELKPGMVINLGLGMPEGIAAVAAEQGRLEEFVLTVEVGPTGGMPQSADNFGASLNPIAIIEQPSQFDFYAGGGLDLTCLGLAEADSFGNINVSRFGPMIAGCGGFIDISQNTRQVVFCGTFTAGGLEVVVEDARLKIIKEGRHKKFVSKVEQVTFSGDYARRKGQRVLYITERAVFELLPEGLTLVEIAPGIDLQNDIISQMHFQPLIASNLKALDLRNSGKF